MTEDDAGAPVAEPESETAAAATDSNDDLPLKPKKVRLLF